MYSIEIDRTPIAKSNLDRSDFPMGIIAGKILPFEGESYQDFYRRILTLNLKIQDCSEEIVSISLNDNRIQVVSPDGESLLLQDGLIELTECEDVGSEITVACNDREQYDRLFPFAAEQYHNLFEPSG